MDFAFRGVELHSNRMWQLSHVERTLDFMRRYDMNALIFHQNDMVDQLVFPHAIFSDSLMWKRWPVRMHAIYNNRKFVNKIIADSAKIEVGLYLEIKELSFPEMIFETVPGLLNADGIACPQNPFWLELLRMRFVELCEALPGLAGVIVSIGSRESRLSLATGGCGCDACKHTKREDWYLQVTRVMHDVLSTHGKRLIMRDFSYTADEQGIIIDSVQACSPDIGVAMKVTPHDFYPTFPTNPKIGLVSNNPQFVEFDTWGQFFGLGVFPSSIVSDIAARLAECKEKDVYGVWFRTDWEVMYECSTANSLNEVNLYAGALLSKDTTTALDKIYRTWASDGLVSPLVSGSYNQIPQKSVNADAWHYLKVLMEAGWEVMQTSSYVRGHVFMEDDQIPDSVERAYDMMVRIHGRDAWDPGASALVAPTEENLKAIRAEKQVSQELVRNLSTLCPPDSLGLPPELTRQMETLLNLYIIYVDMIAAASDAVFTTAIAQNTNRQADILRARESLAPLLVIRGTIEQLFGKGSYPHYIHWLLDELRIEKLHQACEAALESKNDTL